MRTVAENGDSLIKRQKCSLFCYFAQIMTTCIYQNGYFKKVQVGKDQEKAQLERDSHSRNRGGKKPN